MRKARGRTVHRQKRKRRTPRPTHPRLLPPHRYEARRAQTSSLGLRERLRLRTAAYLETWQDEDGTNANPQAAAAVAPRRSARDTNQASGACAPPPAWRSKATDCCSRVPTPRSPTADRRRREMVELAREQKAAAEDLAREARGAVVCSDGRSAGVRWLWALRLTLAPRCLPLPGLPRTMPRSHCESTLRRGSMSTKSRCSLLSKVRGVWAFATRPPACPPWA